MCTQLRTLRLGSYAPSRPQIPFVPISVKYWR